jgi:hypothetical protein
LGKFINIKNRCLTIFLNLKKEDIMVLITIAQENLRKLRSNPYPGRGIIMGLDETGKFLVQVYWIMGRSENSRNRIFMKDRNGVLKTVPVDPEKISDPSLIIYTAMLESELEICLDKINYVVSNGHQTEEAMLKLEHLRNWEYEPDHPNYTPRITGVFSFPEKIAKISILKKSPLDATCDRYFYELTVSEPGLGYCVTTYKEDGNPLPPFEGDPYLLPLKGGLKEVGERIWENLDEKNRVCLAVKFIELQTGFSSIYIINKYKKETK